MNYCNFAKVIIARSTKDKNLLTWWENHEKNDADAGEISINRNCRNSNDVRYNIVPSNYAQVSKNVCSPLCV